MSTVWFGGGEVAAHRALLAREGIETIAVNLSAYFKQRQAHIMNEQYSAFRIVLYSSEGGLDPNKVTAFVEANAERFEMVYGLPTTASTFVPEWGGGDLVSFYALASQHPVVGLTEAVALDSSLMPPILAFARRESIKLMTASAKQDALAAAQWSDVIASGWLAASKHRELQVWDGRIVKRYTRLRRSKAIESHTSQIKRIGVSLDELRNDEPDAGMTLAVRSWKLWGDADNAQRPLVGNGAVSVFDATGVEVEKAIAGGMLEVRRPTIYRDRTTIPTIGLVAGSDTPDATVVQLSHVQMRTCNSCFLANHCPGFEQDHSCAFDIPVRISTKGELQAAMNAMLEMQFQRTAMARFGEDLLSQGLDPAVSSELDRFMRMVKTTKEIADNRDTLTITAKASDGRLSALFGSKVGQDNRALGTPIPSGALMQSVLDGEVLDEPTDDS